MSVDGKYASRALKNMRGAGKGDTPRPVDRERFEENYDKIDWSDTQEQRSEASQEPPKAS